MPTTIQVDEETADELHARKDRGDSYDDVVRELLGLAGGDDSATDTDDTPDATQLRQAVQAADWGGVMYAESDGRTQAVVEALEALRHGEATRSGDLGEIVAERVTVSAPSRLLSGVAGQLDCVETPVSGSDRYEWMGFNGDEA